MASKPNKSFSSPIPQTSYVLERNSLASLVVEITEQPESASPCKSLTKRLEQWKTPAIAAYSAVFAWTTYFLIYGFRKAWSAATWENADDFMGLDPKSWLTIAQTLGYAVGKMASIFVVSSLPTKRRFLVLVLLPTLATIVWLFFGLGQDSAAATFCIMFFTAMPLSWGWTLLYRYLEGRNSADILGAILSSSYVIGSGISKSIGSHVLSLGVSNYWMPLVTSCFYLIPILITIFLVGIIPPPSIEEQSQNAVRLPMTSKEQRNFIKKYWPGLLSLTVSYMILTAMRDFRDFFQAEIWLELYPDDETDASTFFITEVPVSIGVLIALCGLNLIKSNRNSILIQHGLFIFGTCLLCGTQLLFKTNAIGGFTWFIGIGLGIYLAYAPVGAMFYDRLMGAIKEEGTAVFMISISDTAGYAGTVILLIYKSILKHQERSSGVKKEMKFEGFFSSFVFAGSIVCIIGCVLSMIYWWRKSNVSMKSKNRESITSVA